MDTHSLNSISPNGFGPSAAETLTTARPRWLWPLQRQIAAMVLLAILLFGIVLQFWNYRTLLGNEVQRTEEKHLVIAKNLSLSLSRYMTDVARTFAYVAEQMESRPDSGLAPELEMLSSLNVSSVALLPSDLSGPARWLGPAETLPPTATIDELRSGTNQKLGGVQVSGISQLGDKRYFFLGYKLKDGRTAVGYLDPKYIKEVQSAISFGKLGHSAIFDQFGRTVAHPVKKAEAGMADMSKLSAVSRMLNGETGVDTFYSPAMKLDMIAGISFVPETNWPVMVPQPIEELRTSVNSSLSQSYLLASLMAILLGAGGWYLARKIVKPVRQFTAASNDLAAGNYAVSLPRTERSSTEMWQLNESLKMMVSRIANSDSKLRSALAIEQNNNKKKNEFLLVAGHELRTPLNGVIGMLTVCEEEAVDPGLKDNLSVARTSANQLNLLLNDMVSFADGLSSSAIVKTSFNLGTEMRGLALIYKQQATSAGLDFKFESSPKDDCMVVTDRGRIIQVVSKLLDNAIKFTKDGHVGLTYRLVRHQQNEQATLEVVVSDSGVGIDQNKLQDIFAPFSQVDSTFSRQHSGLGIGLAIAQELARKLGGVIECTSSKGIGTRFTVLVPIELA
jgi:signal transduction histidine kinase